jgi:nicotinamidase-related amidase
MADLNLQVRYISQHWQAPASEKDFVYKTAPRKIPLESSALVLVDVWNDIWVVSHGERERQITKEKIVPLSHAFRAAGGLVVHGPSNQVAEKYPAFLTKLSDQEIWGNPQPKHNWPPRDFINKTGPYAQRMRPEQANPNKRFNDIIENWRIAPEMEPQEGDVVIRTGEELHTILEKRRILWLFYAGFATNVCMLNRDYAMKAMANRGFEIILIRDATTGIEAAHTVDSLRQTEASISIAEFNIGYSVTTAEMLEAIGKARS